MAISDEQETLEEFERVLRSERFATIHDVMNAQGLEVWLERRK